MLCCVVCVCVCVCVVIVCFLFVVVLGGGGGGGGGLICSVLWANKTICSTLRAKKTMAKKMSPYWCDSQDRARKDLLHQLLAYGCHNPPVCSAHVYGVNCNPHRGTSSQMKLD